MSSSSDLLVPVLDRNNPRATIEWLLQVCRAWQAEPKSATVQWLLAGWVSVEFGYIPNSEQPRPTTRPSADEPGWIEWLMVSGMNFLLTQGSQRRKYLHAFARDAQSWLAA